MNRIGNLLIATAIIVLVVGWVDYENVSSEELSPLVQRAVKTENGDLVAKAQTMVLRISELTYSDTSQFENEISMVELGVNTKEFQIKKQKDEQLALRAKASIEASERQKSNDEMLKLSGGTFNMDQLSIVSTIVCGLTLVITMFAKVYSYLNATGR